MAAGCRDCGGPKPSGVGRRLCDSCLVKAQERTAERRAAWYRQHYLKNREEILARHRERSKDPEYRRQKAEATKRRSRENPERARLIARRSWVKRKYGLTLEEMEAILARGCAICGTHKGRVVGKASEHMPGRPEDRLCIDHCHTTGKVRDALCHSCNSALGLMADNPERLRAAADYLEKHARSVRDNTGSQRLSGS